MTVIWKVSRKDKIPPFSCLSRSLIWLRPEGMVSRQQNSLNRAETEVISNEKRNKLVWIFPRSGVIIANGKAYTKNTCSHTLPKLISKKVVIVLRKRINSLKDESKERKVLSKLPLLRSLTFYGDSD